MGFSQNVQFSGCDILSRLVLIQSTQFFSVEVCIYKNHVFDEAFFLLLIDAMITEKMYISYFHGNLYKIKSWSLSIQTIHEKIELDKEIKSTVE